MLSDGRAGGGRLAPKRIQILDVRALVAFALSSSLAAACTRAVVSTKPARADSVVLRAAASAKQAQAGVGPGSAWWLEPKRTIDVGIEDARVMSHDGELAILGLDRGAVLFRSRGARRDTLDAKTAAQLDWRLVEPPLVGDWLLGTKDRTLLAAFDARSFKPLWELPLLPRQVFVSVARAGDFAIVATHGAYEPGQRIEQAFTGIHAGTGRMLWQTRGTSSNDQFHAVVAAAGTFWIGAGSEGLQALDAATGAVRWSEQRSDVVRLFASQAQVVILRMGISPLQLETRDARSGALIAQTTVGGQLRRHASVDGGVLFLVAEKLMAFSVATLKLLWEHPLPDDITKAHEWSAPSIAAVDGAVVLCEEGALRAFDRVTGEEVWSYGLDTLPCQSIAAVPGPRVFVIRKRDPNQAGNDTVIEFAQSAKSPETATIVGQIAPFRNLPLADTTLTLGTTTVHARPDGTFEARVTSRGVVRIHANLGLDEDSEKCDPGAQADNEVTLTGAGQYSVALELEQYCK